MEIGLIGGPERRKIVMADYDLNWPRIFDQHRAKIARALGEAALSILHIGSTSVPGLAAKPIIDMLLVVADSANEGSYLPALLDLGYELRVREPDFHEHRMLRTHERDVHIHVLSHACPEIERYPIFRDHLRANAEAGQRYEATKRALIQHAWTDMNEYAEAKTEVIEQILALATRNGSR